MQLFVLSLLHGYGLLSLFQLSLLLGLLIGDFHQFDLELSLVLFETLIQLLELNVSLGYVVLNFSKGLFLLLQTTLVHLVEVDIRHQCIALIAHSVLLFIDLRKSALG